MENNHNYFVLKTVGCSKREQQNNIILLIFNIVLSNKKNPTFSLRNSHQMCLENKSTATTEKLFFIKKKIG